MIYAIIFSIILYLIIHLISKPIASKIKKIPFTLSIKGIAFDKETWFNTLSKDVLFILTFEYKLDAIGCGLIALIYILSQNVNCAVAFAVFFSLYIFALKSHKSNKNYYIRNIKEGRKMVLNGDGYDYLKLCCIKSGLKNPKSYVLNDHCYRVCDGDTFVGIVKNNTDWYGCAIKKVSYEYSFNDIDNWKQKLAPSHFRSGVIV